MSEIFLGGGDFAAGDTVQQLDDLGLSRLEGLYFVVAVEKYPGDVESFLVLSKAPGGDPIVGLDKEPLKFPASKFRRLSSGSAAA